MVMAFEHENSVDYVCILVAEWDKKDVHGNAPRMREVSTATLLDRGRGGGKSVLVIGRAAAKGRLHSRIADVERQSLSLRTSAFFS